MSCFVPRAGGSKPQPTTQTQTQTKSTIPSADEVHLTDYASGLGCACKIKAELLEAFMSDVKLDESDENVLVGTETGDDASVVKVSDDLAIVSTTDFFPPIVDDAGSFGRIATANAISDIYAMGAKPISAISLVGFPTTKLPVESLERIIKGAKAKAKEAGIIISGGHSIDLSEPIFGLAVTGTVHPKRFVRNVGLQAGDFFVLTKPLGTGVVTSALKRNSAMCPADTKRVGLALMEMLNKYACEVATSEEFRGSIHAMTDVTGFGFLGHLQKMVRGEEKPKEEKKTGLVANVFAASVPLIPGTEKLLAQRQATVYSASSFNNVSFVSNQTLFSPSVPLARRLLLTDAQTSGGLLIAVAGGRAKADALAKAVQARLAKAVSTGEAQSTLTPAEIASCAAVVGSVAPAKDHPLLGKAHSAHPPLIVVAGDEAELAPSAAHSAPLERIEVVQNNGLSTVQVAQGPAPARPAPAAAPPKPAGSSSSAAAAAAAPAPKTHAEAVLSATPAQPHQTPDPSLVWFYKNCVTTMGNDELGKVLIGGMLGKALTSTHGKIPGTVILMGDGIEISTIRDDTVQLLQTMERLGTRVLTCTTCLNMLKLLDKLRVGKAATAQEIADVLSDPSKHIVTMS